MRTDLNLSPELRELAKKAEPKDAELLHLSADRLDALLDETDQLYLLLSDATPRTGEGLPC